jgi:hypothetical protein
VVCSWHYLECKGAPDQPQDTVDELRVLRTRTSKEPDVIVRHRYTRQSPTSNSCRVREWVERAVTALPQVVSGSRTFKRFGGRATSMGATAAIERLFHPALGCSGRRGPRSASLGNLRRLGTGHQHLQARRSKWSEPLRADVKGSALREASKKGRKTKRAKVYRQRSK